jgi:hypothetical protein
MLNREKRNLLMNLPKNCGGRRLILLKRERLVWMVQEWMMYFLDISLALKDGSRESKLWCYWLFICRSCLELNSHLNYYKYITQCELRMLITQLLKFWKIKFETAEPCFLKLKKYLTKKCWLLVVGTHWFMNCWVQQPKESVRIVTWFQNFKAWLRWQKGFT